MKKIHIYSVYCKHLSVHPETDTFGIWGIDIWVWIHTTLLQANKLAPMSLLLENKVLVLIRAVPLEPKLQEVTGIQCDVFFFSPLGPFGEFSSSDQIGLKVLMQKRPFGFSGLDIICKTEWLFYTLLPLIYFNIPKLGDNGNDNNDNNLFKHPCAYFALLCQGQQEYPLMSIQTHRALGVVVVWKWNQLCRLQAT